MTHRFTLVRHGQSVANRDGVVQGHLDSPLSELGRRQAAALASAWKADGLHFDGLLSSPLLRARQTAEIFASSLALELEMDDVWMERDLGRAQGMSLADFLAASQLRPACTPFEPAFETGESAWALHARAARAVQDVVRRPAGEYLIVSHGGLLNAVLRVVLGIPPTAQRAPRFHFSNGGYARLAMADHGSWALTNLVNPPEEAPEEDDA
jgi:broad specificity phosphatase PhoE